MSEDWSGNPLADGSQDAAQKALAVTMLVAQGVKHMQRVKQAQDDLSRAQTSDERELLRRELRTQHEQSRGLWGQVDRQADEPTVPLFRDSRNGLDPVGRMQTPGADEFRVWASAQPFVGTDPEARRVAELAETRLQSLQPGLVRDYREHRDAGVDPVQALATAAERPANWEVTTAVIPAGPDMSSAARAAETVAGDERQEAMTTGGRADDPTTPNVDERSDGLARSADMREHSVVQGSKAKTLAAQAQPYSIDTRLAAVAGGSTRITVSQPQPGRTRYEPAPRRR